ncbi:hypothetical protein HY229_03195 [Candidatus Acetothermia bacterium]|nr:hypothetical protein [Candidatus Acetothermia bacterium]
MERNRTGLLLAILGLSMLLGGCQMLSGASHHSSNNTTDTTLTTDQLVGFWESQAQSVGKTGYYYRFNADGTLALSEEKPDNLVLTGTFKIDGAKTVDLQLTNPRDNAVILAMTWQLMDAQNNELVFRIMPDDGVVWLRKVN